MSGAWIFTILLAIFAATSPGMGLAYVLGALTYMASYFVWLPIEKLVGPKFLTDAWPFWISSAIFAAAVSKATMFPGRSFSIERGGDGRFSLDLGLSTVRMGSRRSSARQDVPVIARYWISN
jgi:hypothetical protein